LKGCVCEHKLVGVGMLEVDVDRLLLSMWMEVEDGMVGKRPCRRDDDHPSSLPVSSFRLFRSSVVQQQQVTDHQTEGTILRHTNYILFLAIDGSERKQILGLICLYAIQNELKVVHISTLIMGELSYFIGNVPINVPSPGIEKPETRFGDSKRVQFVPPVNVVYQSHAPDSYHQRVSKEA
jgi:hypothetical protein